MPPTECSQCGMPYEAQPELSTRSMEKTLFWVRFRAWFAILFAIISMVTTWIIWPSKPSSPLTYETTGPGIVRYYGPGMNYTTSGTDVHRADVILFENAYGAMKIMQPICQSQLGIHAHMQVEIIYRWAAFRSWHSGRGPENGEECYDIHDIKKTGPDIP